MKPESRRWFDLAYEVTRGVPFAFVTGHVCDEFIRRYFGRDTPYGELERLKHVSRHYARKLPPEEDFEEEKARILETLTPELRRRLPFVDTAVYFGTVRGDIDIGLISREGIPDEWLFGAIPPKDSVVKGYPIVDWGAVEHFKSASGGELALKIRDSRLVHLGATELPPEEHEYVKGVVYGAQVLWGDEVELEAMKAAFEGKIIIPGEV